MKSICIKINNDNILKKITNELTSVELDNIYFSTRNFKNFKNVIIHFLGNDDHNFFCTISSILSFIVLDDFEDTFLKNSLKKNHFYFSEFEQSKILSGCYDILIEDFNNLFDVRFEMVYNAIYKYIADNKSFYFIGFLNFRVPDYIHLLSDIVSQSVNSFIIEKEYLDFISLLQTYIKHTPPNIDTSHLIYLSDSVYLLDKNKNEIKLNTTFSNSKYLSDISFSNNDYILNTLLDLLPNTLYIHTKDEYIDEFIDSLLLVFNDRAILCTSDTPHFVK